MYLYHSNLCKQKHTITRAITEYNEYPNTCFVTLYQPHHRAVNMIRKPMYITSIACTTRVATFSSKLERPASQAHTNIRPCSMEISGTLNSLPANTETERQTQLSGLYQLFHGMSNIKLSYQYVFCLSWVW